MRKFLTISFCLFFFISSIKSQISITNSSFTYSQDFNSLANTGTSITWTDNMTITGWYSDETTYNAGTGSSNTGALYSFGAASSSERALGGLSSGGPGTIYYGARFVNNTGATISSIQIGYTGEQWRDAGNNPAASQTTFFEYRISATGINTPSTGWVAVSSLDFASPTYTTTAGALDGNLSANKITFSPTTINVNLANNTEIWFRWRDINDTNNDHGLAIDDFTLSSIILPITYNIFNAFNQGETNSLTFTTASETNNDYFTIERSGDGVAYEAIGEIKGAGNSSKELSYEFTDEKPLTGLNYYRIKQTDFDGQYSYSEVRSVRFTDGASVTVSPRTTEGRIDITTDMEDYNVEVYTAAGAQVKALKGMNADQSISLEDLKAGIYFLRVSNTTASETVRVIKL